MGELECLSLTVPCRSEPVPFYHYAASRGHILGIFQGRTYPILSDIGKVSTIVDIGANVGAASVMLAAHHPAAVIHAFEPGPDASAILIRNTATFPRVHVHPFGLGGEDRQQRLYRSQWDPMSASIRASAENSDSFDLIEIRNAAQALGAAGVTSIDILKIDTEGCEVSILSELFEYVARVKVLYLEYHSETDRRRIDALLAPTHTLAFAAVPHPHRGDVCYLHRDTDCSRRYEHVAIASDE